MQLNNREKAWLNRKQVKKESHPTYASYGKYAGTLKERMKKVTTYYAFSKQRREIEKEFNEQYGAWWLFTGKEMRYNRDKTWIEQFHVEDPRRPRGKGIYKRRV